MQSLSDYPEKLNSLGEVQRIIGLSLSKIQLGRNQRGGLPLHKNLLVATVLNKARDLYMQETMYMNYKMMTGHQFGMVTAGGSDLTAAGSIRPSEEEMDDPPENEDTRKTPSRTWRTTVKRDLANLQLHPGVRLTKLFFSLFRRSQIS